MACTRRNFLSTTTAALAAGIASSLPAQTTPSIPAHLPHRLAICYYGWDWITSALPDEPYGNLERAIIETKERGFNCIRPEMGLNWMFDPQGQRCGKLKFLDWIPGASSNLHCVDARGGGVHDVYERVLKLFELADKHGLYVIMTEWEYQDAVAHTADVRVRDEIIGVPYHERLLLLARHYDRLLQVLKKRGLHKRIVSVEIINELNGPPSICSSPDAPRQTFADWVQEKAPDPLCTTEQVRELAHKAVAYVRERHPDLLVTVDGLIASPKARTRSLDSLFPDNAQIVDHHPYSDGLPQAFFEAVGFKGSLSAMGAPDLNNAFLKSVLKPNLLTWDELTRRATRVRRTWWPIAWLYTNLDNDKYDKWCAENYPAYRQRIKDSLESQFQNAAQFAKARNLPMIQDEGFIFYPPLHAKFLKTPEGREGEELGVNAAIATGHWGVMLSGYFRPNTPFWRDEGQADWARSVNQRILASG